MRRRKFITLIGSATVGSFAWLRAARSQEPRVPVVGYVTLATSQAGQRTRAAFLKGLSETGFVEGRNVAIEFRYAQNERDRLPDLVRDLIRRRVAVIVAAGVLPAVAAKALTTTIPVVYFSSGDPVQLGLVASLNRPGGNITGFNDMSSEIGPKQLDLLHQLLPKAEHFGILLHPTNPWVDSLIKDAQSTASAMGRQVEILSAATERDIDTIFASLRDKGIEAIVVTTDTVLFSRRTQILTLAARYSVPIIYPNRLWSDGGGLMSYGPITSDLYRQVGIYTGRILKGEKPAELPVMRASKFEFIINLQTARAMSIDVPATLLATADEVIE